MTIMGPPGGRGGRSSTDTLTNQAKAALVELPSHLRQIGIGLQRLADQGEQHYYTVAPANNGRWGVFCLACSDKEGDYVWPCRQKADHVDEEDHPPQLLAPIVAEAPTST